MGLDFAKIKALPILAVCGKYGIKLRFNGEWGSALCPLPSHKHGEKDKTFQVSVRQNFWKCWSDSCNETAGQRGGDVINLVAIMENCSQYAAAKKLTEWFHIDGTKSKAGNVIPMPSSQKETARHTAERSDNNSSKGTEKNITSPSEKGNGYMHDTGVWLDEKLTVVPEESRTPLKKALMEKIRESYLNGKKVSG